MVEVSPADWSHITAGFHYQKAAASHAIFTAPILFLRRFSAIADGAFGQMISFSSLFSLLSFIAQYGRFATITADASRLNSRTAFRWWRLLQFSVICHDDVFAAGHFQPPGFFFCFSAIAVSAAEGFQGWLSSAAAQSLLLPDSQLLPAIGCARLSLLPPIGFLRPPAAGCSYASSLSPRLIFSHWWVFFGCCWLRLLLRCRLSASRTLFGIATLQFSFQAFRRFASPGFARFSLAIFSSLRWPFSFQLSCRFFAAISQRLMPDKPPRQRFASTPLFACRIVFAASDIAARYRRWACFRFQRLRLIPPATPLLAASLQVFISWSFSLPGILSFDRLSFQAITPLH